MKRTITALLALCLAMPAAAADLGGPKPAPAGTVVEVAPANWTGLYLEGSAAAAKFKVESVGIDSFALIGVGLGYDHKVARGFVVGAKVGFDYGRNGDGNLIHLGLRAGYLINPHLLLYIPLTYTIDGSDPKLNDGIWSAGAGLETFLLGANISIFAEGTRSFSFSGGAAVLDEATLFRGGLRYRF